MGTNTVWIKYRRISSSTIGEYNYKYIRENEIEDFIENLNNEYHWSEHHRGYEWQEIDKPPKEVMDKIIKSLEEKVQSTRVKIKMYKDIRKGLIDENNQVCS